MEKSDFKAAVQDVLEQFRDDHPDEQTGFQLALFSKSLDRAIDMAYDDHVIEISQTLSAIISGSMHTGSILYPSIAVPAVVMYTIGLDSVKDFPIDAAWSHDEIVPHMTGRNVPEGFYILRDFLNRPAPRDRHDVVKANPVAKGILKLSRRLLEKTSPEIFYFHFFTVPPCMMVNDYWEKCYLSAYRVASDEQLS